MTCQNSRIFCLYVLARGDAGQCADQAADYPARLGRPTYVKKKHMITLAKLLAAGIIGVSVLHPTFTPRVDTCECKTKSSSVQQITPRVDTCECKAKTPS